MSRAIPANFNEYLLDQTTRNIGIICDGGIMPMRNNPDPWSTWRKECLRGEDIMFLKEAVAARQNAYSNDGLNDTSIKESRLQLLQTQLGQLVDNGWWTDVDPRAAIGMHDMGSTQPDWSNIAAYLRQCMNPITQHSAGDTYLFLDHVPVQHMFEDISSLAYTFMTGQGTYYTYQGYTLSNLFTYHHYKETRHTYTPNPDIVDEVQSNSFYMWHDSHYENYNVDYPGGIESIEYYNSLSDVVQFKEASSQQYRRFHRYLESVPYGIFEVNNEYYANWDWKNGNYGEDSWSQTRYVLASFPVTAYIDTLTATTLLIADQAEWNDWAADVFTAANMKQFANEITGQYVTTDYRRYRRQIATIEPPIQIFWVTHFKYCSLN